MRRDTFLKSLAALAAAGSTSVVAAWSRYAVRWGFTSPSLRPITLAAV